MVKYLLRVASQNIRLQLLNMIKELSETNSPHNKTIEKPTPKTDYSLDKRDLKSLVH